MSLAGGFGSLTFANTRSSNYAGKGLVFASSMPVTSFYATVESRSAIDVLSYTTPELIPAIIGWRSTEARALADGYVAGFNRYLKETGVDFTRAYTSVQRRAIRTLYLALDTMDRLWLPVTKDWHLNERHYGGLTGLDKAETGRASCRERVCLYV